MIVQFKDSVTGTAVYINPEYVVTVRPDPAETEKVSMIKIRDGETIRVLGDHPTVADKLVKAS